MGELVIKAEGICKKYEIFHQKKNASDSIVGAFTGGLKNIFKAKDTYQSREDFWALQDIYFEINKGDRVGIIGRNGAGKSTLLKILSRIIKPTKGSIEFEGRMASLLEVGTGFHGDLSGRENIYLNGSILGMRKREIDARFDEIVDFAEVEKFLDTPVKKYSSGMYVRLAFAVAANLDPDILIVDEVLAVGDAQFQRKCIGKMEDVSNKEGRTILFVSHNMGAVQNLCTKGLFLQNGKLLHYGQISSTIKAYMEVGNTISSSVFTFETQKNYKNSKAYFTRLELKDSLGNFCSDFPVGDSVHINVQFESTIALEAATVGFGIVSSTEFPVLTNWTKPENFKAGLTNVEFVFEHIYLTPGIYKLILGISRGTESVDYIANVAHFNVSDIINMPHAQRLVNTSSGLLLNQFPYKIS
jgi:lipopolysaccharide transport system ATP-binding protein